MRLAHPGPLVAVLAWLLVACGPAESPTYQHQFFAFGTLVDITVYGVDASQAEAASLQIETTFSGLNDAWHAWQPGPLRSLNEQLAVGAGATPDPELLAALVEANRLSDLSKGLFNPLMGRLVALWGFHGNALPIGELPVSDAVKRLVNELPDASDITVTDGEITSNSTLASYDLGGFAKGLAIDHAIGLLRDAAIENAIVNAGGDLRAIGQHGSRPWRIGIRHPRAGGIIASLEIAGDESVFTSGDYERYFEVDGKRYHHIIDPRSGYPAAAVISVTVLHPVAAMADAAATALFVAGPDEWLSIAANMGISNAMLIDHLGKVHMTPGMQKRLHFEPGISGVIPLEAPP